MDTPEIGNELVGTPLSFEYVVLSLLNNFSHHTFYAYLIQGVLILYAFVRGVGRNGNFWKIIYIGTLASFVGAIVSNICEIILTKQKDDGKPQSEIIYYIVLCNETLYALRNLVLPYINMIKVNPLLNEKEKKNLKIFIGIMTAVHFLLRYNIGLYRLKYHDLTLNAPTLLRAYGYATISVALTDIVCSMIIIKKLIENYHIAAEKNLKISVYKFFFQSALFTLIFVDFFSLIMGILAVVSSPILQIAFVPLIGLNSNIILLLAFDALIFKNDIMIDMNFSYNYSYYSGEHQPNEMSPFDNINKHNYSKYSSNSYNSYTNASQSYYQSNYYHSEYQTSQCNSQCFCEYHDKNNCKSHSITISDQLENTYDYVSRNS